MSANVLFDSPGPRTRPGAGPTPTTSRACSTWTLSRAATLVRACHSTSSRLAPSSRSGDW